MKKQFTPQDIKSRLPYQWLNNQIVLGMRVCRQDFVSFIRSGIRFTHSTADHF